MTHSDIRSRILSTGGYLPPKILNNDDLAKIVDTSDEWIQQRSGIKQRHIADDDQATSSLAIAAAKDALARANMTGADIDGIIVATTTPDKTFPAVAVSVQDAIQMPPGFAFDVQAVCSGFIYALSTADAFIKSSKARRMLVIGAEKMSSILDWKDRTTCVLFADGAGAVILEGAEGDEDSSDIVSTHLYSNGAMRDMLCTTGGPSTTADAGVIEMQGREVFKYAVQYMSQVVKEALDHNGLTGADIDWLVPHQANIRIIEATAKKLGLSMDNVVVTVDHHGNTSAASIPLALHSAVSDGRIQRGDTLLLEAMGGGFTWGAALIRY